MIYHFRGFPPSATQLAGWHVAGKEIYQCFYQCFLLPATGQKNRGLAERELMLINSVDLLKRSFLQIKYTLSAIRHAVYIYVATWHERTISSKQPLFSRGWSTPNMLWVGGKEIDVNILNENNDSSI